MKYMLMIYADESKMSAMRESDAGAFMQAYGVYTQALVDAGVMRAADRLRPVADATSVRVRHGRTEVIHGPYADTLEQLGGYYLIEAPDLDVALSWAARCPSAPIGTIEVRPVWEM